MLDMLTQAELEELNAYVDGELDAAAAAAVRKLLAGDARWQGSYQELLQLDAALETYESPAVSPLLAAQICQRVRNAAPVSRMSRLVSWAVPAAAAAAIVLTVFAGHLSQQGSPTRGDGAQDMVGQVLKDIPPEDQFAVENLDFFKDMDVLENFDTLQDLDADTDSRWVVEET